jgi:hypothetical protein
MSPLLSKGLLLAVDDRLGRLRLQQGFMQQSSDSNMPVVFVAVLAICLIVILIDQLYRARKKRPSTRPVDYLAQAARVLGLSRCELRLVRRIGRQAGLAHPAIVLLSPANLGYATQRALRDGDNPRVRARIQRLCRALFDTDLPADPLPPTPPTSE